MPLTITEGLISQNSKLSEQVLKDVIVNDIKKKINIDKFMMFASKILNYIGNQVKISSIFTEANVEHRTGKEYLDILIDSNIIQFISNLDNNNLNSNVKKVYFTDNGLIDYFNNYRERNAQIDGKIAENAVYNYLDRKYNSEYNDFNVCYINNKGEIDFIVKKEKLAIEVKYSDDIQYIKESIDNFNNLVSKKYKKIIITKTLNQKDLINNIEFIAFEKFITTL